MVTVSVSCLLSGADGDWSTVFHQMMSSTSGERAAAPGQKEQSSSARASSSASAVNVDASNSTVSKIIKVVWDFEHIEKFGGPEDATKKWRSNWCGLTLKVLNATKALSHVTKTPGNNDVKACSGNIPKDTLAAFQKF